MTKGRKEEKEKEKTLTFPFCFFYKHFTGLHILKVTSHWEMLILTTGGYYPMSVHPKGDQSWVFIGKTDVEAETPILWLPDWKSWLMWKDPDAGKDWGREEKGMTEDEMVGWHHWLNGHEWVNSGSWWWTGRPGVLQFMGSQRVRYDWVTELTDWHMS